MLVRCLSSLVANSSSRVLLICLASFRICCVESFLSLRCFPHRTTTNVAGPAHHHHQQQQQPQNPCFRYSTAGNIPQLFPSLRSAVFLWKQTYPINDDENDVILLWMQELQACIEMAPRDPIIAVARAESIFTQALASMADPTTTANKNKNQYEDIKRDLYHALMATNAMAWSPNDNDTDDSAIERIQEILNDMVDGQGHPTPTDESYAWLLEAYLQRRDGQGAQQVWEALVEFEEAQPDFSLTPRLWKKHEQIVGLQQEQEQPPPH